MFIYQRVPEKMVLFPLRRPLQLRGLEDGTNELPARVGKGECTKKTSGKLWTYHGNIMGIIIWTYHGHIMDIS